MGHSHYSAELNVDEIIQGIEDWVLVESPSHDAAGVNHMMDLAEAVMIKTGASIERVPGRDGFGDLVKARTPWGGDDAGILVLGHLDTVHPVGTLDGPLPFRREGDKLYGPGIYDMKGGMYIACYALHQILGAGATTSLPITFMFIPDEEMGSPTTRALIEAEAKKSKYVLVPEPAQDAGRMITGRWAFARFWLHASGTPAHAGATLNQGHSAIREMAQQIIRIENMSDPERNITLSVGVIHGGTFVNVVPIECRAEVLAVMPTQEAFDEISTRMLALGPLNSATGFRVEQGPVRPLFKADENVIALYRKAETIAAEIGFDPGHGEVGGGSDGNFTGHLGIPTLDGLGVCGNGFHTHQEHLFVSSLVPRTQVLMRLFKELK
jgi:glutamate carboxypeptidase